MNIGEQKAIEYYSKQGFMVRPVMDDSAYWYRDIDLIVAKNGTTQTIECKYDTLLYRTGNIFVETITDIDKHKPGWFQFITAEKLFVLDAVQNIAYIFAVDDLRRFIENHPELKERKAPDYNGRHEIRKVSQGLLVPIRQLQKEYEVEEIQL